MLTNFKYIGTVVLDDCFKPEVLSSIEQATYALTKLKLILTDNAERSKQPLENVINC